MIVFHTNIKRKQNGYTLIELLLVVTVIAVIAALGIKTYRDKAESDRINIAALNVQHVLESAMSYNVAHTGLWPQNNWTSTTTPCATGAAVQDQDFLKSYLPNESNQSNFGAPLCWDGDDATLGPQKATRFWVAFSVGNDEAAVQTAQRIAARLPNAIITNDPSQESSTTTNTCTVGSACYIKAVVSVPSVSTTTPPKTYIAGVGACDGSVAAHIPQSGWNSSVNCARTTLGEQYSQAGASANDNSLGQYRITFACKPGEVADVQITPNFLQVERMTNTQTSPLYELKAQPKQLDTSNNPIPYCGAVDPSTGSNVAADGTATCTIAIKATYGHISGGPTTDVGCKKAYTTTSPAICTCPSTGCEDNVTQAGYVGASYTAVCSVNELSPELVSNSVKNATW